MLNIVEFYFTLRGECYRNRLLKPPKKGIILEIGSGASPTLRANVLLEKYLSDGFERGGQGVYFDKRILIQADALHLPFKDGSVDFVICSHLLEHMDKPGDLIREMERVSGAGYIETPSTGFEKIMNFPFHKWFVDYIEEGHKLILRRKKKGVYDEDVDRVKKVFKEKRALNRLFRYRFENGMMVQYMWKNQIEYVVIEDEMPVVEKENYNSAKRDVQMDREVLKHGAKNVSKNIFPFLKRKYGQFIRRNNKIRIEELREVLVCPDCRGALEEDTASFTCDACNKTYEKHSNVICFLK